MTPRGMAVLAMLLPLAGAAQEPTFMDAATQPGLGQYYSRLLLSTAEYRENGALHEEQAVLAKLAYGLPANLALQLEGEFSSVASDAGDASGFALATVRLKYRFLRRDLGPLDTWRAAFLAGADLPGTRKSLAPDDPAGRLGAVTTAILGRHGLNAQIDWRATPSAADGFALNASHLYRLAPAEYAPDTKGAWYSMLESLNAFDSDGAWRADLAGGLLYEARRWAAEASIRTTAGATGLRENRHLLAAGLRYLF